MHLVETLKKRLCPILRILMFMNPSPLGISTRNLENQHPTGADNNIGGPDLDIYGIDLTGSQELHIGRPVLPPGQVWSMPSVIWICLAKGTPQPAFCYGARVTSSASVENFPAFWRDMANRDEEVHV